jgi:hypothetical protein
MTVSNNATIVVGLFTYPLLSNGRGADHIENTVLLLLCACCGRHLATAAVYRVTA